MDGLRKGRVSYVVHWGRVGPDWQTMVPESRIFEEFDRRLAEFVMQLRGLDLSWGPIVEKVTTSQLNRAERRELERLIDGL